MAQGYDYWMDIFVDRDTNPNLKVGDHVKIVAHEKYGKPFGNIIILPTHSVIL